MNVGIRSRILTSVVFVFYLHMLHNMNTNLLIMSGCIPGQSLMSFKKRLSLATKLTNNYIIFLRNKISVYVSI